MPAGSRCAGKSKSMIPGLAAPRRDCAEAANSKEEKQLWFWWPVRGEGRHRGVKKHVSPGTTIYTDGLKSYSDLEAAGYRHVPRIQPSRAALRKGTTSVVPLADRAIGNLQQWLIGTHHGVSKDQLQVYLDEFVFRHNRRKQPMAAFQTLLGLGTAKPPTLYNQIRGAGNIPRS